MSGRSAIETLGLAILCIAVGWLWRGTSERANSAEAANASITTDTAAIENAAKTASALARIEARTSAISAGLKANEKAIASLADCPIDAELGRLFQLRVETINSAAKGGNQAGDLPGGRGD